MKIDNRQKLLTIAAFCAVVVLAGERLAYTPLKKLWTERANRIADLRQRLTQGELRLEGEKSARTQWAGWRKQSLPEDHSLAENQVLKAVDRWVRASAISFTSIKPMWRQSAEDYTTLECHATAMGDMQAVTRFLYELEQDPLPLRVEDLEVTSRDPQGQQLSLGIRFTALLLAGEPK